MSSGSRRTLPTSRSRRGTKPEMRRVALVTGGTRGIGLGIARCLAGDGYDLALCGTREAAAVAEVVDSLRALGAEVVYCRADVGDAAARARLVEAVGACRVAA